MKNIPADNGGLNTVRLEIWTNRNSRLVLSLNWSDLPRSPMYWELTDYWKGTSRKFDADSNKAYLALTRAMYSGERINRRAIRGYCSILLTMRRQIRKVQKVD